MSSTRIPTTGRVSKPKQSRSAKPSVPFEQAVNNEQNASPACPPRSKISTRALDEAQEKELIEWIRRVNKLSHSPNAAHIAASEIKFSVPVCKIAQLAELGLINLSKAYRKI
jgi:hypothetical protein